MPGARQAQISERIQQPCLRNREHEVVQILVGSPKQILALGQELGAFSREVRFAQAFEIHQKKPCAEVFIDGDVAAVRGEFRHCPFGAGEFKEPRTVRNGGQCIARVSHGPEFSDVAEPKRIDVRIYGPILVRQQILEYEPCVRRIIATPRREMLVVRNRRLVEDYRCRAIA